MPTLTATVTTADGTLLWRRDYPYRGVVGDAEMQEAAAARRIRSRMKQILGNFNQPNAYLERTDTLGEWLVRVGDAVIGHARVTFDARPAPAPDPLPIRVRAETAPGVVDPSTRAAFADEGRAREYAHGLDPAAYVKGGVYLTDRNGTRHRITPTRKTTA